MVGPGAIHDKGESTVRKSFRLAAGVVALGLVAAACSEDNGTSSGTTAGEAATTAAPATTTATSAATGSSEAPTTTGSSNADRDKVALDYVGATEAKAASGDPITIGYVNQEGVPGASWPCPLGRPNGHSAPGVGAFAPDTNGEPGSTYMVCDGKAKLVSAFATISISARFSS